jgi:L-Ala-D/L-Glu epimerase / N-acetyl-D-glutamate racemase
MKIKKIEVFLFSCPFHGSISLSESRYSSHLIIKIWINENIFGIGEAPLYSGNILIAKKHLEKIIIPYLENIEFKDIQFIRKVISKKFGENYPSLTYCITTALYDLEGKIEKKSINEMLGTIKRKSIPITKQIFIDKPEVMIRRAYELVKSGCKNLKIKIGRNPKKDIETIRRIAEIVPKDVSLRVDVNHSYSPRQAITVGAVLKRMGVDAIEEPCDNSQLDNILKVKNEVGIDIILDESIKTITQLKKAIEMGVLDILNIKLTRIGGIDRALDFARLCEKNSIKVLIGCSEELGIGMSAIAHFASTVKNFHSMEGLGSERLGFDIITQNLREDKGKIIVPVGNGLGVDFSMERLLNGSKEKKFEIIGLENVKIKSKMSEQYKRVKQMSLNSLLLVKLILILRTNPRKKLLTNLLKRIGQ